MLQKNFTKEVVCFGYTVRLCHFCHTYFEDPCECNGLTKLEDGFEHLITHCVETVTPMCLDCMRKFRTGEDCL